jgi:hypothetical protein
MVELVLVLLAGALVLDVVLELWRDGYGVQRRRELERDRVAMLRTLDRTGGRR